MTKAIYWSVLFSLASILCFARAARADLQDHGGPVIKSGQVVPYYYGPWQSAALNQHQAYLTGLTQYLSGANASANTQSTLVQYGVTSAGVAAPVTDPTANPVAMSDSDITNAIHAAQALPAGARGQLPPYSSTTVILFLLPTGVTATVHCGYHSNEGVGKYYAVVTQDCGPWLEVTAHEVFETVTDPAVHVQQAWDEVVDPCGTSFNLWFGPVPGAYDNSIHGCSTTGYDTIAAPQIPGSFTAVWSPGTDPEIQLYGQPYGTYRAKYDELWPLGWRLKVLEPYVSSGNVYYNAVWTPSTSGEIQVYGYSQQDFIDEYNTLWPQGWRPEILVPYVVGSNAFYTAVWTPSTEGEIQVYGWTEQDFVNEYNTLWGQGWRLKIIQPYVINGQTLYTAVWRPSTAGEIQVYGWTYANYRSEYDTLWSEGDHCSFSTGKVNNVERSYLGQYVASERSSSSACSSQRARWW
jgi:hypothetical protein